MKKAPAPSFLVAVILPAGAVLAEAQQLAKVPRIGLLIASSPSPASPRIEAFQLGPRELGYVEGKNIVIEYRYAEGKPDRLPALAADLVRLKIDIIVTGGSSPTRAAKEATVSIPIVMTQDIDPVGSGFVASLARPGGNITGLSNFAPELSGKRIELLKEIAPKISRVAVLGALSLPANAQGLNEVKVAAEALRLKLQYLDIQNPTDIESAFRAASKGRAEAALALPGAVLISHRPQIAALSAKNRLPAIYYAAEFVEDGGLMSYAPHFADLSRRAATYVDKILKGANPADLPVEQPMKFELVINLKAAKQIRLRIPQSMLEWQRSGAAQS